MITISNMPLYWRCKDSSAVGSSDPPERFPFGFDYNPELDLFIEARSPELSRLLADIYSRHANVGFLQDGHSLVQSYGQDFWKFLQGLIVEHPVRVVVDVGCGGCVLLERLKALGYEVLGIDPSPFAAEAGARKGIKVIQELFPPKDVNLKPDLFFQVDVLEHIEDPVAFLRAEAEYLNKDGMIVVNVPDCSNSLNHGDISMALHQHVNMFDARSLPAVFRAAGLDVVKLERSQYGSSLYCAGRKAVAVDSRAAPVAANRLMQFESRARRSIQRFQERLDKARRTAGSIGFFMPQRAFPFLGMIEWFEGFRVFDNLNLWHRRFLDGLSTPIENQVDLVSNPVDHVFVMSLTFGREVGDALRKDVPGMKVTTIEEILN